MNVIDITRFGQTANHYVYVDATEHLADEIFKKNDLNVKFVDIAEDKDSDFVLIQCTLPRRTESKFEEAMNTLDELMQNKYGSSYILFCRRWEERLKEVEAEASKEDNKNG